MTPRGRSFLLRWHRRLGLVVLVFVAVLAVTGIALNHPRALGLETTVHHPRVLQWYGITPPAQVITPLEGSPVVHDGVDRLYRGTAFVGTCPGDFAGAVTLDNGWVAACGNTLRVFDAENRLLERLGPEHGVPGPLERLGRGPDGRRLALASRTVIGWLDLERLRFTPVSRAPDAAWAPVTRVQPTAPGAMAVPAGSTLTLERVLRDIHSGRLFGALTVWLMDLAGVALLGLGLSGLLVWSTRRPGRARE